jgi:indolepyruvate ferredoxin oxidoreductase
VARRLPLPADNQRASAHLEFLDRKTAEARHKPPAMRPPIFCSGCPHNISTRLPEGSRALVGTGCHLIAAFLDRDTDMFIQMGGEGAHWVGQAPFCKTDHIFQNLGDGTYVHSGYLALRQAVAADTTITFKILFNDAVAMTGGQPFEGGLTVPQITRQVHAEGVGRIAVVTPEAPIYPAGSEFAPGVTFHQRDEMDALQRDLRNQPGVSVLIYDQVCATEKRRRRKRGQHPKALKRVFINRAVCEDCGDCVARSSCVSVVPVATPLGRKRAIDQSACNEDLSCLEGFCPSMVTIEGAELNIKEPTGEDPAAGLDSPSPGVPEEPYGILIAGIGGEGVVTVGQILGMAAHLDGLGCATLDFTGLAQKGGGVLTHVRIAIDPMDVHVPRLPTGGADLLIAGDLVVATGPETLSKLRLGATRAVVNDHLMPIADNILDPASSVDGGALRQIISQAVGAPETTFLDAIRIAEALTGDRVGANIFLLGHAFQKGYLPLSEQALAEAMRLNGVAAEANRFLFAWGRRAAHDPASLQAVIPDLARPDDAGEENLDTLIERHAAFLTAYRDAAYGERYERLVETARRAESARAPNDDGLARTVAQGYFKLLAYKDEYEVARLFTDGRFEAELAERFQKRGRLTFHMAPPFLGARNGTRGHPGKRAFGPWMLGAMGLLARCKGLRGTPFDPFGRSAERRMERQLIAEYEATVGELLNGLSAENHALARRIAALAQEVRGFGPIKMAAVEKTRRETEELTRRFRERERPAESEASPAK